MYSKAAWPLSATIIRKIQKIFRLKMASKENFHQEDKFISHPDPGSVLRKRRVIRPLNVSSNHISHTFSLIPCSPVQSNGVLQGWLRYQHRHEYFVGCLLANVWCDVKHTLMAGKILIGYFTQTLTSCESLLYTLMPLETLNILDFMFLLRSTFVGVEQIGFFAK